MTKQATTPGEPGPGESGLALLLDNLETQLSQDRLKALVLVCNTADHPAVERLQAGLFFELLGFVENLIRSSSLETERDQACVSQLPPEMCKVYSRLLQQRSRLFGELRALVGHANRGTLPRLRACALAAIVSVTEQRISERLARRIFTAGMAKAKDGGQTQILREQLRVRRAPAKCPDSGTFNAEDEISAVSN